MSFRSMVLGATLAFAALASSAQAAVITFKNTVPGEHPGLVDYSEAGFTHSVQTGGLFVTTRGDPGKAMAGSVQYEGGVLDIVADDGSLFTFKGLDFAAYGPTSDAQFLLVTGFRDSNEVGTDFFLLDNTNLANPNFSNWTWFDADALNGLSIDKLSIHLAAGGEGRSAYFTAIDNVTLGAAVPEPGTWAMMIVGFGLAGAVLRLRPVAPAA